MTTFFALLRIKTEKFFPATGEGILPSPATTPTISQSLQTPSSSINLQVTNFPAYFKSEILPYLKSLINSFCGGQIQNFLSQLETLTSDPTILQTAKGEIIDFISDQPSNSVCPANSISKDHITKIDQEISTLLKKKVIVASSHEPGEYISPIFSVPKKDNKVRLILNLKRLNEHARSFHFKMDSIHTALSLVTESCWMASLDLKDAYYSVRIHDAYQKFLKFSYKGTLFQYTAYPNGLSTCTRNFRKLLKPVLCVLRKQSHILIIFIDDIVIIATSYEGCVKTILAAIKLLGWIPI